MNLIPLKKTGLIVFFVLANLVFWGGMFFGLDFTDSFFHINAARSVEGKELYSSFFLSSVFINFISEYLGEDLIIFRLINSSLLYISIFLPFLIGKKSINGIGLFYIGCILYLISPLNANILGYDTFSIFFISLIFSTYLKYVGSNKKNYWILILSILGALTVFIRLPNVIVILILFSFLIAHGHRKKAFIFLLLAGIFIWSGYYLVYRNFGNFINSIYGAKSHLTINLIIAYFKDAVSIILYILFIGSIYFIYHRWKGYNNFYRNSAILVLISVFVLLFISFSGYWKDYSLFLTALAVTWIGVVLFREKKETRLNKMISLFFISLLFVIPFGSNTGLLKASLMLVLFPFVLSQNKEKKISIWKLILMVMLPFSLMENFSQTYEDGSIIRVTDGSNLKKLKPIMTTEFRNAFINSINKEVDSLEQSGFDVIFYGNKSHLFNYLYPSQYNSREFNQPLNDSSFFQIMKNREDLSKTAIFLIDKYPERKGNEINGQIENKLYCQGFEIKNNGISTYLMKK